MLSWWLAQIPTLPASERPAVGQAVNRLKKELASALVAREAELEKAQLSRGQAGAFDPTLPPPAVERGTLHPLTVVSREIEDLFISMGYQYAISMRGSILYQHAPGPQNTRLNLQLHPEMLGM